MQKKLKVQYSNRRAIGFASNTLPKIQMEGKWLAALGFQVGKELEVSYKEGSILIRLAEQEEPFPISYRKTNAKPHTYI